MFVTSRSVKLLLAFLAIFFGYFSYQGYAPYNREYVLYLGLFIYILTFNIKVTKTRASYLLPFLWDVSFNFGALYWLTDSVNLYGDLGMLASNMLLLVIAMILSIKSIVITVIWNARGKYFALLPILITAVFYLFQVTLYNFNWLNFGYSEINNLGRVLAPIGGVWLVQFIKLAVVTLVFAIIYNLFQPKVKVREFITKAPSYYKIPTSTKFTDYLMLGSMTAVAAYASFNFAYVQYTTASGAPVSVALVQPDIKPKDKWDLATIQSQVDLYQNSIDQIITHNPNNVPQLVIFPESAIGLDYVQLRQVYHSYATQLQHYGSSLLTGAIYSIPKPAPTTKEVVSHSDVTYSKAIETPENAKTSDNNNSASSNDKNQQVTPLEQRPTNTTGVNPNHDIFFNTALLFTAQDVKTLNPNVTISDGIKIQRYDKKHLVPFGEYLPLASLLRNLHPFFTRLDEYGFTRGTLTQPNLATPQSNFAIGVCYDALFGAEMANEVKPHTGVLISISNDVWFGNSEGPEQHMNIVRYRAIENQRYILRDSNNGVTAIVNPRGDITNILARDKNLILYGTYQNYLGSTPYEKYGNWLNYLLMAVYSVLAFGIVKLRNLQRQPHSRFGNGL